MSNNNVQPIFIMPEDTKRSTGKDAQHNNIAAAKAVAQTVRSTLGPKGMDKMIVDSVGEVIVTNDGVTILKEIQIEHPAARMVVEIAKTQEEVVGDGTTTAVILAGELLKKAEDLLDQNIHPTILAKGYRLAEKKAQNILQNLVHQTLPFDDSILKNIAITAMTGKGAEANKDDLAELVVKSIKRVSENNEVDLDNIKVEIVVGDNSKKSKLIDGIVLDKEIVHANMPKQVIDAKIVLIDCPLEIKNTEIDAKIQITDPSQLNAFLEQEENTLKEMVQNIIDTDAKVVICQRGIDELAQHFLSKQGILAIRRVKKSDMEKLARATSGKIISNLKELNFDDLGFAGKVSEKKINDEEMIFIENCQNPKAVSLLINGGTIHIAEEIKRAVTDALGDVAAVIKEGKVVTGAGAVEMQLAKNLRSYARSLSGRVQLAVLAYAEAMEVVPITLAENAGLDPIDILTKLRSAHDRDQHDFGLNVFTGEIIDAWSNGIIEPLKIKTQALSSATEVAEMILRIDDVILGNSGKNNQDHQIPSGM